MAAMGSMGMGLPEDPMGAPMGPPMGPPPGPMGVDMGGMGVPPVAAADPNEMMLQALLAVLGKWEGTEAQIAGEQNSLMETLMLIASAQPPGAAEAGALGGSPMAFGMDPAMEADPNAGMI